ncbi:hypothetical protein ABFA07_013581 [Porites harrisoni]
MVIRKVKTATVATPGLKN